MEKTLVLLKPDCVKRRLIGRVISRFEEKGLGIAGMKLMQISQDLAAKHYEAHKERPFYASLMEFMTKDPVVAMVLTGPNAIDVSRMLMGATFGFKANPGTIRGDFGISNQYNLVHGSDSAEAAEREIGLFFPGGEGLLEWATADADWHTCD